MTAPIAPRSIPVTEEDGSLSEDYMPERLSPQAMEPPVDLVLLFENGMA
ncbi:hypothetical protein SEA_REDWATTLEHOG_25 [Gordonia phage RedWattleHog]|uniref:Uncharacterized protein n=1 Tax=Gordonia phage Stormageddon TaxID=2656541 RepID=A0A649VQZ4_9CAUD|nr:hypothetical protein KHQ86_gp023 [Gordonia phage Stormageddon]QGJ94886.1 hypothetical protein SEA_STORMAGEDDON_23 [Gordonia phage Stormageddon]QLF83529.1 hypothetical protein SEA_REDWATTLEHOG_25 [Gordonia phage RedWattleHog]